MLSGKYGAVAAGHPLTAEAAIHVLESGGNAFDAIVAATANACVSEPVLASLGGGGFLTARAVDQKPVVYDFFVQTPSTPVPHQDSDFYPVLVDFGATQQEFHIGTGSIATPGVVKGLFEIQRELGVMPMTECFAPAIETARRGLRLNALQAYLYSIVSPMLLASRDAQALYGKDGANILEEGDTQRFPQMADLMETLAIEGPDLFYRGEVAQAIIHQCEAGGHLSREDLSRYEVIRRRPHSINYGDYEIVTNPPPSSGGILVGFALQLIDGLLEGTRFGTLEHLHTLVSAMEQTNKARLDSELNGAALEDYVSRLDEKQLMAYKNQVVGRPAALRGTTHISVADAGGNLAALTLSNGEGCGNIVQGCGFMLNNMLGEEDLNPGGFGLWKANTRMTSMMSPGLMRDYRGKRDFVFGSGGSNRIRSAILQVLLNIMQYDMDVEQAVKSSRLHFENDKLNIEKGFAQAALKKLKDSYQDTKVWDEQNLFFGGVHTVLSQGRRFDGAGDFRRGGIYRVS